MPLIWEILFNINKLNVEYWEDFETSREDALAEAGIISYQETLDENLWDSLKKFTKHGIDKEGENLSPSKRVSYCLNGYWGVQNDYLQFTISNTSDKEKDYTLSFMFRFREIATDSTSYSSSFEASNVIYELPIKLVSIGNNGSENILKGNIKVPYRCNQMVSKNKEFWEMIQTVTVPAGQSIQLRLKLDGDLPLCQVPSRHTGYDNIPHPVAYSIDNVAISSGSTNTITLKKEETYQLQLDTLETDTVEYYTNSYRANYTHSDMDTTCTRFDAITASVDETGLITASTPGETALIAVITHQDGTIERKQCIVQVTE